MKSALWMIFSAFTLTVLAGCHNTRAGTAPNALQLRSSTFSSVDAIPSQFTCDGADVSPVLSWNAPPTGAKSFALIVYDQSTPASFTHWQIYNLPLDTRSLPQGIPAGAQLPNGARQTVNSFDKIGYGGPCPPRQGSAHNYVFQLYALDTTLNLPADTDQQQLRSAMKGHILAEGRLISTYRRQPRPLPPK